MILNLDNLDVDEIAEYLEILVGLATNCENVKEFEKIVKLLSKVRVSDG